MVSIEVLLGSEIESEVIGSIKLFRRSTYVQINSPLTFLVNSITASGFY